MLQRNDTGYPITSYDVGQVIYPGEVFDFGEHITGCTDLDQVAEDATALEQPAEAAEPGPAPEDTTPQQAAEDGGDATQDASLPDSDAPQGDPETTTGSEGEVA